MQTRDHLILGRHLLDMSDCEGLHEHRRAFLLGCIEPDINLATYLRGIKGHKKLCGHHADNSFAHLAKSLSELQTHKPHSTWDYFKLGSLFHYLADAFTWPHNECWTKNMLAHFIYESQLHRLFVDSLDARTLPDVPDSDPFSPISFFCDNHGTYSNAPHRMATDCDYIIAVCEEMLLRSLRPAPVPIKSASCLRNTSSCEGIPRYGLV